MILSLTGHRPNRLNKEWDMDGPMSWEIMIEVADMFDELKPTKILNGMALGFDQIAAKVALLRGIPIEACIPYEGQESKWSQKAQARYIDMLNNPLVKVNIMTEGGFANWKFHYRNKYMVNNSAALVCCWNGDKEGGTASCVEYAHEKGIQVYNIWKEEWKNQYA